MILILFEKVKEESKGVNDFDFELVFRKSERQKESEKGIDFDFDLFLKKIKEESEGCHRF